MRIRRAQVVSCHKAVGGEGPDIGGTIVIPEVARWPWLMTHGRPRWLVDVIGVACASFVFSSVLAQCSQAQFFAVASFSHRKNNTRANAKFTHTQITS